MDGAVKNDHRRKSRDYKYAESSSDIREIHSLHNLINYWKIIIVCKSERDYKLLSLWLQLQCPVARWRWPSARRP